MYLAQLNISNFRKLQNAELNFQPGLNILVGANNMGRTAVGYGSRVPGYYNIKVLRTALEGNVAHANYALSEASGDPILMRLVDG